MSADNGIYILITTDEYKSVNKNGLINMVKEPIKTYRVAHAQAIDDFDWYKKNEPHNLGYFMYLVWGKSPIFYEEQEALNYAIDLSKKEYILEYGIQYIEAQQYNFPGY